ncbi:MAG: hypothetical protein IJ277_05415 [Bacteroidaceae bacterium]|nr:hypothetical protein [Bacteroidaceae bacterium]
MSIESEALSCLLMRNVFAPSVSTLAKRITCCGRNTLYRIRDGVAGDDAVADVWRELMGMYRLADAEIYLLYAIFDSFYAYLPDYKEYCGIDDSARWKDSFMALCKEEYDGLPKRFRSGVLQELLQLKSSDTLVYYGNLVLFYIYANGADVNTKGFVNKFRTHIQALCSLFEECFPSGLSSKEIANELLDYDFVNHLYPCTLTIFLYSMRVVRSYLDADFLDEFLKLGVLFNMGEFSYWHAVDEPYREGAALWFFEENPSSSPFNGSYRVSRLVMGKTVGSYSVEEHLVFFFKAACDDGWQLPMLEITSFGSMKYIQASYELDRENGRLKLHFDRGDDCVCWLPREFAFINIKSPAGKEEKVWARVVNDFIANDKMAIRSAFDNSVLMKEYEDVSNNYKVNDVAMNRKEFSIYLSGPEGDCRYTLHNDRCDFITDINALSRIVVLRHRTSGELLFFWNEAGKYLPFSAFEVEEC